MLVRSFQQPVEIYLSSDELVEILQDLGDLDPARENEATKILREKLRQIHERDHSKTS